LVSKGLMEEAVTSKADVERIVRDATAFAAKQQKADKERGFHGKPVVQLSGMHIPGGRRQMKVTTHDMDAFFESPFFEYLSNTCCFSLYFPPDTEDKLPLDWDVNGDKAQRLRDYVGRRNGLIFNGGNENTQAFINRYFSSDMKSLPIISGFAKRKSTLVLGDPSTPSAIPEAFDALPAKLLVGEEHGGVGGDVHAVDTMSLPGGTSIVYNNFPRHPTGTPAFVMPYCQVQNPFEEGGVRLSVARADCPDALAKYGTPCECGEVTYVGWDWKGAEENAWDVSTINAQYLAEYYGAGVPPPPERGAFVGGPLSITTNLPKTEVDRRPSGTPDHGLDPARRNIIQEWENQDTQWAFWARGGGWRDICGGRAHPLYDPKHERFYTDAKEGGSTNYVRHWCGCWPKKWIETETKQGYDTEGCETMPDYRPTIAKVSPRDATGTHAEWYEQKGDGYAFQRIIRRNDDRRYDERYPVFVQGNGGDEGVWMDENDAGPPPPINDNAHDNTYVPIREEEQTAEERPFNAALDDEEPPAPRLWSWTGVVNDDYTRDLRRLRRRVPDTVDASLPKDPVTTEQDSFVQETDPEGEGWEGSDGGLDGQTG